MLVAVRTSCSHSGRRSTGSSCCNPAEHPRSVSLLRAVQSEEFRIVGKTVAVALGRTCFVEMSHRLATAVADDDHQPAVMNGLTSEDDSFCRVGVQR